MGDIPTPSGRYPLPICPRCGRAHTLVNEAFDKSPEQGLSAWRWCMRLAADKDGPDSSSEESKVRLGVLQHNPLQRRTDGEAKEVQEDSSRERVGGVLSEPEEGRPSEKEAKQ